MINIVPANHHHVIHCVWMTMSEMLFLFQLLCASECARHNTQHLTHLSQVYFHSCLVRERTSSCIPLQDFRIPSIVSELY